MSVAVRKLQVAILARDNLGRYLKWLVSNVIPSSHEFESEFDLAFFIGEKHAKTIANIESPQVFS